MHIRILRNPSIHLGCPDDCVEGAEVDVEDKLAQDLITKGIAEDIRAFPQSSQIQAVPPEPKKKAVAVPAAVPPGHKETHTK